MSEQAFRDAARREREITARNARRRAERKECPVHAFEKHGKEADELRRGVEKIIEQYTPPMDDPNDDVSVVLYDLEQLLERVDARDSLAYVERKPRRTKAKAKTKKKGRR